jgi:hypothetical protein
VIFLAGCFCLRVPAGSYGRLLRRILRRIFDTRRTLKIFVSGLQVVPLCHSDRIADPVAYRVDEMNLGEIGFTAGPEIVKQLRPGFHLCPTEDPKKLCPEIDVRLPVPLNNILILFAG